MYICMCRTLCSRRPYSPDCHGGAKGMYYCALENITLLVQSINSNVTLIMVDKPQPSYNLLNVIK